MFCHLHIHNEYSFLDGVGRARVYLKKARELGQQYLALTNHGNIDGLLDFQNQAKGIGIKPIMGCELYVVPQMQHKASGDNRYHLTALIKNETGFQNLCQILTKANLVGFYHHPRIDFDYLLDHYEGLVFLSGCSASVLRTVDGQIFLQNLSRQIPGDVYLEVMPHRIEAQVEINRLCVDIAGTTGMEMVATNDCHYINEADSDIHEVLLAIQTKAKWNEAKRFRFETYGLFLRSEQQMKQAFIDQGILTKAQYLMAMRNTVEIAEKCSGFKIAKKEVWLPVMREISERDEDQFLQTLCDEGYQRLFHSTIWDSAYQDRFKEEFELIKKKGFVRYFLLVWELVNWCRSNGIMTGPGRGSVGGSLIAYLMGITSVDPLIYGLLFSRFIDVNRIDFPDIDIDFEDVKRSRIREHLEELYGKNQVASVSTFMKMKGRGVLRDVARVFDVPYKDVDVFAKAIFDEDNENNSVERASKETPEGIFFSSHYPKVVDYAIRLEGQIKGCSQHAAALIVSAEDLTEGTRGYLALRSGQEVINWSKDDAEYMGLMKLDVLGLNTLSVLNETKRLIMQNHGKNIVFESILLDDPRVFEMLSKGETVGVFQFNTWSMTKMVKEIGVDNFGLMSDILALVRPGPLDSGMAADFSKRKHGAKWKKKHRIYERITKDTFGIIVYQEQVMQVINLVAGLPYSVADKIRKIVAKKRDAKLFAEYEQMFIDGCLKEGTLPENEARGFWDALQNYARYSFNKSHSIEYAMIAYWCAWLKLYFPAEFICANLTFGSDGKKEELVKEAKRIGLNVVLPRVGISDAVKWVVKGNNIYVPFIEIKGVGEKTAQKFALFKPKSHKRKGFFNIETPSLERSRIGRILEEIGAIGSSPISDLSSYFSFDVSMMGESKNRANECFILQKKWRDPELIHCKDCELRSEARQPVLPSRGIYNVMIIGEAPGRNEDEQGMGFIGKSGDLLWSELEKHGMSRRQFHITNTCKCYPGNIRTPKPNHISACSKWIDAEIKNTGSKLCLALGNIALKYFKGEDGGIMKICGTTEWIESKGVYVCWGLHPSAVLRNPDNKFLFQEGIKNFINQINLAGGLK